MSGADLRRRVVHVIDSELVGGAERALLTLLAGTDLRRWDPVLAHHPCPAVAPLVDGARELGIQTWAIPLMSPGADGLRRVPRFIAGLRRHSPAIVHLHLTWPLGCQYPQLGAYLAGVPAMVATVQLYVELSLSRRVYAQQRFMTRAVDRYIAVSADVRSRLIQDLGWPAHKIDVVHNGVDTERSAPVADSRLRERLGGGRSPLVLVPARLAPQKGQRYLLEAAVLVPDVRFIFAGDGPDRDMLEALARELGVDDRVMFLGERRDIAELLTVSDLVVLPSLYEGLPLALLEAMACGKPVISSRIPGVDELVTSDYDGVLVTPGRPQPLAAAVRMLLENPDTAERLGRAGRCTVESRFSSRRMCERVLKVYDEILAR